MNSKSWLLLVLAAGIFSVSPAIAAEVGDFNGYGFRLDARAVEIPWLISRLTQKRQIYTIGVYSDGVERDIRDAGSGTTYSTSNEKIVIVNSDGLATAVGPGETHIIVINGNQKLVMNAVVRPKKDKAN